jgi:hypothetical protein
MIRVKFNMLLVLPFLLLTVASHANDRGDDFQALRAELLALAKRVNALESSNHALREENERLSAARASANATAATHGEAAMDAPATRVAATPSWAERIKVKGDFRMRYENIDEAGRDSRNRSRLRARAAIMAAVTEDVEVGLGLASGSDDPVSSNQTLGGGGSSKDLKLDLAYFKWSGLEHLSIYGGKFKNPLYQAGGHPLLWDGDWNPEGLALSWARGDFFAHFLGTWLESDSRNETEFSWMTQTGFSQPLGAGATLTAGLGYHHIGSAGKGTFYGDDDDFFGNSFDPASLSYLHDYDELEAFADLGFEIAGQPARLFLSYVHNLDASAYDTGYAAGFRYGSTSARGGWSFAYAYQDLEADAAFALVADSDFGGGGTDVRGHLLKGGYAIAKNWNASLTYFVNQRQANAGSEHDYDRLQLDLAFKH